nr:helix-turn-helix domain-containing protein [Streptomyces sp. SID3343]
MTPAERERREKLRLRAGGWFAEGVSRAEVARRSGVSPQAVSAWHGRWVDGGGGRVAVCRSAGRPPARVRRGVRRGGGGTGSRAGGGRFHRADPDARSGRTGESRRSQGWCTRPRRACGGS